MGWFSRDGETCPDCGKFNKGAEPSDRCTVCNGLLSHDGSTNAYPRTKTARRKVGGFLDGLDLNRRSDDDFD